jgi:hypothetical protein
MNYTAILLDRVEKKLAAWTHNQCLGEIFLKLVPSPGSPRHHPMAIADDGIFLARSRPVL